MNSYQKTVGLTITPPEVNRKDFLRAPSLEETLTQPSPIQGIDETILEPKVVGSCLQGEKYQARKNLRSFREKFTETMYGTEIFQSLGEISSFFLPTLAKALGSISSGALLAHTAYQFQYNREITMQGFLVGAIVPYLIFSITEGVRDCVKCKDKL